MKYPPYRLETECLVLRCWNPEVAAKLTEVALGLDGIDRVEIRHEPSNLASGRVPEKLGYTREALLRRVNNHFEGELRDSVVWVKFR